MKHKICGITASTLLLILTSSVSADEFAIATTDPLAFGIPMVTIYVDGPNGGTIDWQNTGVSNPWPDGACGFRIDGANMPGSDSDPTDDSGWAWYGGVVDVQGDPLPIENNGIDIPDLPGSYLEFTGPYGDNCEDGYVFNTPATPTSQPPAGAVALVIQFYDWDDIEFLDAGFEPWSAPDGDIPPDPNPEDPALCENGGLCNYLQNNIVSCFTVNGQGAIVSSCPDGDTEADRISGYVFIASWLLGEIADTVGHRPADPASLTLALNAVWQRLESAEQTHQRLQEFAAGRTVDRDESIQRSRLSVGLNRARVQLESCQTHLNNLAQERAPAREAIANAVSHCRLAAGTFSSIHEAATAYRLLLRFTD